ncbi:hypothetical protein LDG_6064 [Legionella drancourtii LLAP12]|uniref:Uncharacterized protein n=1 Tax=Legionella drancourtii LLAP12 TaxID=658187 RepID=G9ELR3_9GAMM|nr:hypothetical protein LDG_6064 [Legionella drancourtii LLAP12]
MFKNFLLDAIVSVYSLFLNKKIPGFSPGQISCLNYSFKHRSA